MTEAERVAAKLTEAQREMLLSAKVGKPLAWLKGYMIDIDCCGRAPSDAAALEQVGLVSLPIRRSDRATTLGFYGEILPLGLEVRKLLDEEQSK